MNTTAANPQSEIRNPQLAEATILQWTWKTDAMRRMAVAICKLALEKGLADFSANDLPDFDHGGSGVAGVIFNRLANDGVLARVGTFEGTTFFPRCVLNAGGNKISVYRIKDPALARRLLEVHGQPVAEMKQTELLPT